MDEVVQVDLPTRLVIPVDEQVGAGCRHPEVVVQMLLVDDTISDLGDLLAGGGGGHSYSLW